jgi:DNA-binding CsgD family transcriptional regulator
MIAQFNAWFQKAAINLIMKQFMDTWGEVYKDVKAINHTQYLESTKMFDLMANNRNTLYLLFDVKEFKILYCSNNFETMTGHPTSEILTKNVAFFFEILNKKDILFYFHFAKFLTNFNRSIPIKSIQEYLQIQWSGMTMRTKDGRDIEALFKINPFERDDSGLSRLCIITVEDVTHFMKKDPGYWARMEAGKDEKFISSFFEDDTKFMMKDILSDRELEILKLVAKGTDSKAIAESLYLSIHTVEKHRKNMLHRLGVRDSSALLEICRMCNMI